MTLLWCVTGASLIVALVAWNTARRLGRRLEQLSEMYWELTYQHGELRAQLKRDQGGAPEPGPSPAGKEPTEAFVPLTSLRR